MRFEIKHRWSGKVLFETDAASQKDAVVEAVKKGAYLRGADLGGAYLRGADLGGADLRGAYLGGADLGGAYLGGADLGGADLRGAYLGGADLGGAYLGGAYLRGADLGGAYLRGADLPSSPLFPIRLDLWAILDQTPAEAAGLRTALVEGRVDGSVYEGECACLVGTIANVRGVPFGELGIPTDASRPAEMWFAPIKKGDVPDPASLEVVTVDPEAPRPASDVVAREEAVFRATLAVEWIDEWVASRTALVAALAGKIEA